jgi:hypothetical protein
MDVKIDRSLLEAYSRAEISRRDISERMDAEVGFGDLLAALHAVGLPLPRFPAHPDSPGVKLIKRLAERRPVANEELGAASSREHRTTRRQSGAAVLREAAPSELRFRAYAFPPDPGVSGSRPQLP